jgi:hypothetical protein
MRQLCAILLAAATAAAAAVPARAGLDAQDLEVAARALSFMEHPPSGTLKVGIIYDPANSQSTAEAQALQQTIAGNAKTGNLVLEAQLVTLAEVGSADVGLFLLTDGLGEAAAKIAEAIRAKHVPCVTGDIAQVKSGVCAIGVRSDPRIEILVNNAAAAASGVSFSTAFRMLITEF